MLRVAQYHNIPLPKGWPRRVRSAVIQVISLARIAGRITPSRGGTWPSRRRLISVDHFTDRLKRAVPLQLQPRVRPRSISR